MTPTRESLKAKIDQVYDQLKDLPEVATRLEDGQLLYRRDGTVFKVVKLIDDVYSEVEVIETNSEVLSVGKRYVVGYNTELSQFVFYTEQYVNYIGFSMSSTAKHARVYEGSAQLYLTPFDRNDMGDRLKLESVERTLDLILRNQFSRK